MMIITVSGALLTAFIVYLCVGFVLGKKNKGLADLLPLSLGRQATVKTSAEFSASTVATTISLATVVLAFFELAPKLGVWLFWTVITTSLGLLAVRWTAKRIWIKLSEYDHRPTLHEFLGKEFNSSAVHLIGAACTSLGFLSAFAVELTVGSRFLAGLLPAVPTWIAVGVLAVVGLSYTSYGGFRAVIVTDRIQMISIWILLAALGVFYYVFAQAHGGWSVNFSKIPYEVSHFTDRENLWAFILGIAVINVPTFISDMGVWQRIAGSQKAETVFGGLWSSVISSAFSWGFFVISACLVFMVIIPTEKINPLLALLHTMGSSDDLFSAGILFLTVVGLYGAMLSTASTQLIAVSHTIYEDIISRKKHAALRERMDSASELRLSRIILCVAALLSTFIVVILSAAGFSIADFVFAIYGAQLGLFVPIVAALYMNRERLQSLSRWTAMAMACGFLAGWGSAGYGEFIVNSDLVFLAPVASLVVSSSIFGMGFFVTGFKKGVA